MMFYLAAPWLVRRRNLTIVLLAAVSLALRAWVGLTSNLFDISITWAYKFLPFEYWSFLAGILMFRVYRLLRDRQYSEWLGLWALGGLALVALSAAYVANVSRWVVLAEIAVFVPLAFLVYDRSREVSPRDRALLRIDGLLGDLSYPLYISHVLVLLTLYTAVPGLLRLGPHLTPAFAVLAIAVAFLLLKFVGEPVERIRAQIRARAASAEGGRAERRREARAERRRYAAGGRR